MALSKRFGYPAPRERYGEIPIHRKKLFGLPTPRLTHGDLVRAELTVGHASMTPREFAEGLRNLLKCRDLPEAP
jgi:hypothetical protein